MIDRDHELPITKQAERDRCRQPNLADASARRATSGVPFRRKPYAAGSSGCRGMQVGRRHADAADGDGDGGALSPPTHHQARPGHKIYPYLLRGLEIERPNQVWAMDITYIPMARLAVVLDWFSRRVLAWRLSIT